MRQFFSLVNIFIRQMLRSKAIWLIIGIFALMALANFYNQSRLNTMLNNGVAYDVVTQQATGMINSMAEQIKIFSMIFTILISALLAPASRKNGTTQFAISMQVSRMRLAAAQFTALSIFIAAAVFLLHAGYCIFAARYEMISIAEMLFSWIFLLVPLLMTAAVSFSLSLAFSSIVVYLIIFGIPGILLNLIESLIRLKAKTTPLFLVQLKDNIALLFPEPQTLIFWPYIGPNVSVQAPPYPVWTWTILNAVFIMGFWLSFSYAIYRNHNIGSRQPLK